MYFKINVNFTVTNFYPSAFMVTFVSCEALFVCMYVSEAMT